MKTNIVDAVLCIDRESSHYNVELSHKNACEFLRRAKVYNNIPRNIAGIVSAVRNAIGPMQYSLCNGSPNPNNGKFDHIGIKVGNENSRVIYVSGHRTPGSSSIKEILSNLESVGIKFEADENDLQGKVEGPFEYFTWRYWWD